MAVLVARGEHETEATLVTMGVGIGCGAARGAIEDVLGAVERQPRVGNDDAAASELAGAQPVAVGDPCEPAGERGLASAEDELGDLFDAELIAAEEYARVPVFAFPVDVDRAVEIREMPIVEYLEEAFELHRPLRREHGVKRGIERVIFVGEVGIVAVGVEDIDCLFGNG